MMIRLSKHIEILLLSNDCVIVPGFGGFMAHHVDARKDNSDGSFLPPIRSIGFNPKLTINDSLLAQSYVEAYDISYPEALMRIEDEVRELCQRIEADGKYEFKGIGIVSLNKEGNYEFSPCEAGILSPSLYGLGSFQIKTLSELKDYTKALIVNLGKEDKAEIINTEAEHQSDVQQNKHSARIIGFWRNVAVVSIAIIFFLLLPSPLVNNSQIAGTKIDTNLLEKVLPKDLTSGEEQLSNAVKNVSNSNNGVTPDKNAVKVTNSTPTVLKTTQKEYYSIVVASHVTIKNAKAYVQDLQRRGYNDAFVYHKGHVKVLIGHFPNEAAAYSVLNKLNDKYEFAGAWIKKVDIL